MDYELFSKVALTLLFRLKFRKKRPRQQKKTEKVKEKESDELRSFLYRFRRGRITLFNNRIMDFWSPFFTFRPAR